MNEPDESATRLTTGKLPGLDASAPLPPSSSPSGNVQPPLQGGGQLAPGTVLAHSYEIVRLIRAGGMGEVYEVRHLVDQSRLAIKMIRQELIGDERIHGMFVREASILRKIRDEAIVGYEGLLQDEQGRGLLVMSFVDGPSLAERLKHRALTVEEGEILLTRLAQGLAAAHEKGAFHRDLSPDNILLPGGRLERAVIIDFGIAKLADRSEGTFIGTDIAGKYGYMSPEQIGVVRTEIDGRTDIYSLALVIAAAVRGRPLDMGQSWVEMVDARRRIPTMDGISNPLRTRLAAMLAPDPADRPQGMKDLISAPQTTDEKNPMYLVPIIAGAVGLFVLVGVGFLFLAPTSDLEPPEDEGGVTEINHNMADTALPAPESIMPVLDIQRIATEIRERVTEVGCAQLDVQVAPDGVVMLSGSVAEPIQRARVEEIAKQVPGVTAVQSTIVVETDVLCATATLASVQANAGGPPPGLRVSKPGMVYYEGEYLMVFANAPIDLSGHLYVDLIDGSGQVVHLLPNPLRGETRIAAGGEVQLGKEPAEAGPRDRTYSIGAPFGRSILVAWFSTEPLFPELRDEVEEAQVYLPALEAALAAQPDTVATSVYIETKAHP